MRRCDCRFFLVLFAVRLLLPSLSRAQEQSAPQGTTPRPLTPKELKQREKKLTKELSIQDGIWLRDEVPDIITDAERRAFLELGTEEEREQFIEHIFWDSRNPDPESPINTVKEEHYRRLIYA